ncbi:Uncharacterised protein [Campylobacter geochelonis]|nr:Uncharacterised protein [Campylobacter geochelonis]CZE49815.1 Uncharacterised protein [Campylobacter geochelonis]
MLESFFIFLEFFRIAAIIIMIFLLYKLYKNDSSIKVFIILFCIALLFHILVPSEKISSMGQIGNPFKGFPSYLSLMYNFAFILFFGTFIRFYRQTKV